MASIAEHSASRLGGGVIAFVLTPFAVTAIFRLFGSVPTALPFLAALLIAAGLWATRRHRRNVAWGIATSTVVYAVLLVWLFGTVDHKGF